MKPSSLRRGSGLKPGSKPRLLDLFCGAGGATKGYQRAGFHVTGVDLHPQPNYCGDEFVQADAMGYPLDGFDAVHASPPCHDHSTLAARTGLDHGTGWMLEATVRRLQASGLAWVAENVATAVFPPDVAVTVLCGSSFGLRVRRHRKFASNVLLPSLPCRHKEQGTPLGVYGTGGGGRMTRGVKATREERGPAMGIDWPMSAYEISQAIPPAYTEWIGAHLLAAVEAAA